MCRLAFCDTKCVSGETFGSENGAEVSGREEIYGRQEKGKGKCGHAMSWSKDFVS